MKAIHVTAGGPQTGNVVFDQIDAGVLRNKPARAVIRADGKTYTVDGTHKLVKAAIERGDLISLDADEPTAGAAPAKADK